MAVNFRSRRILAASVALCLALIAFGGVSLASAQTALELEQTGGDQVGQNDTPSGDRGSKGEFASGGDNPSSGGNPSSGDPSSGSDSAGPGSKASSESLPFTGYLAIPVLLIGVAMLGTGFVLRRRAVY